MEKFIYEIFKKLYIKKFKNTRNFENYILGTNAINADRIHTNANILPAVRRVMIVR